MHFLKFHHTILSEDLQGEFGEFNKKYGKNSLVYVNYLTMMMIPPGCLFGSIFIFEIARELKEDDVLVIINKKSENNYNKTVKIKD